MSKQIIKVFDLTG